MRFAPQDGSLRGMLLVIMTFNRILHEEVLDFEKSHTSGPFHQVGKNHFSLFWKQDLSLPFHHPEKKKKRPQVIGSGIPFPKPAKHNSFTQPKALHKPAIFTSQCGKSTTWNPQNSSNKLETTWKIVLVTLDESSPKLPIQDVKNRWEKN